MWSSNNIDVSEGSQVPFVKVDKQLVLSNLEGSEVIFLQFAQVLTATTAATKSKQNDHRGYTGRPKERTNKRQTKNWTQRRHHAEPGKFPGWGAQGAQTPPISD